MYYVGCDLHKHSTYFYVVDVSGTCILNKSIPNDADLLNKFLSSIPKPFKLAVEATYNWYFFIDIVACYTNDYYLTNPLYLKAFARRNKKTDKIDAKLIANILRIGYLPGVYIVNNNTQRNREILRQRMKIIQDRCRIIFRLKALLDKLGIKSTGDFATIKRLKDIETENLSPEYQHIINEYRKQIIELLQAENRTDVVIRGLVEADHLARLLMTIDGVGSFSALLIKSEIADISRFKNFDHLCSYAGLAPRVHQSGDKCIIGSLSKNRRKHLQWILLEISYHFMQRNAKYKNKFERIKENKSYNKAKVVIARDLLKIIYRVLKTNEPYYKEKNQTMASCAVCGV